MIRPGPYSGIEAGQAGTRQSPGNPAIRTTKGPRDAGQLLPGNLLAAGAASETIADLVHPEALEALQGAVEDRKLGQLQTA